MIYYVIMLLDVLNDSIKEPVRKAPGLQTDIFEQNKPRSNFWTGS